MAVPEAETDRSILAGSNTLENRVYETQYADDSKSTRKSVLLKILEVVVMSFIHYSEVNAV